jgi:hypothetical protein
MRKARIKASIPMQNERRRVLAAVHSAQSNRTYGFLAAAAWRRPRRILLRCQARRERCGENSPLERRSSGRSLRRRKEFFLWARCRAVGVSPARASMRQDEWRGVTTVHARRIGES